MKCCRTGEMDGPEWAYRSLNRAHHLAQNALFEKLGLRDVGQPIILFILSDKLSRGESCSQKELGDILNLSAPTVTISIKSLVKRGYVVKKPDETDMRRNNIEITPLGLEVEAKCRNAFDLIDSAMYAGFSEDERELVTGFFRRSTENLLVLAGEGRHKP